MGIVGVLIGSYCAEIDVFANEKVNAEKINSTTTWSGNAQKVIYDKYKKCVQEYLKNT